MTIACRACGEDRPLDEYRLFATQPEKSYMDFCVHCEKRESTITLYRRFHAYGTADIVNAVYAAERIPPGKRTEAQTRLLVVSKDVQEPTSNEDIIRRELARRELASRRLIFFTTAFLPEYKPGWVHQDICRRLERFVQRVERGESPRLMIAMPPRAGKSQLASDILPSWILGKHPEWGIIGASYAQSLPVEFSRNIRDRLKDPEYAAIFPNTKLRADSQGVEAWKTTKGGGYIAAGVGVGINGKGMHIGIADDLIKDAEAAQSDTIRSNSYSWYQSVFRTRLAPGGGILLIGTRWHDADVQGQELAKEDLLRKQGVPEHELESWEVVSYPAIADNDEYLLSDGSIWTDKSEPPEEAPRLLRHKGEALHPERYSLGELMKLKHSFPPAIWSALYQQNPTPDDGEFFKRSDFRYQYLAPGYWPAARVFITFDLAISTKKKNDYTVGAVFALTAQNELYVLDIVRGRWGTKALVEVIVNLIEKYKPEVYAGERGQIHEAIWPLVKESLQKKGLFISNDDSLVPLTDKEVRARPLQGRTQMHQLFFSFQAISRPEIYDEVEKELLRFPNGTHDDIVDALAWGARLAMNLSLPTERQPKQLRSWRDDLRPDTGGASHMAS